MSAKFLHVLSDENPELRKQVGCMTGIFQMFDQQQLLNGRRLHGHSHKKHPAGHAISTRANLVADHGAGSPKISLEGKFSKNNLNENQRISMESSRTSFSSSSCSSFSSLDYSKSAQQEALLFEQTGFPDKLVRSSPRLKPYAADGRPPRCEPRCEPPNACRSLDFRDVVKESINRDVNGLSIRTSSKEEVKNRALKHGDSPRPVQPSQSREGSYVIGSDGKSRHPDDLNDPVRRPVKPKEAHSCFSEYSESPRTSFDANSGSFYAESREAHRFSYDGVEMSRQSLDFRDNGKLPSKLGDFPRLSLDSREGSLRNFSSEPKSSSIVKDSNRSHSTQREQEFISHKRSTSVVAKLMGLEAMPSSTVVLHQNSAYSSKHGDSSNERRPKPLKIPAECEEDWLLLPKRSTMDPVVVPVKDPGLRTKPVSNLRVPIEASPWKQQEKHHAPQKATHLRRPESVYCEIEKRLKELEFKQSNKDLRALKQILDAMQEKGFLETKKSDQKTTKLQQNLSSADAQHEEIVSLLPTVTKGSRTLEILESPIVIMKPANSVKRSGVSHSSVIPLRGISDTQKLQGSATMDKKVSINHRVSKGTSDKKSSNSEDKGSHRVRPKAAQVPCKLQQLPRGNGRSSLKSSEALSPRLQNKRLEAERSRPPHPSLDSNKSRAQPGNRKTAESVSPRRKLGQKPAHLQVSDEQLSECTETRNFCSHFAESSQRSDSNISLSSQGDIEVTSADLSADNSVFQEGCWSPSGRAARKAATLKNKKPSIRLSEEAPAKESATAAPEQPSPISVLDASLFQDELPSSPLKKTPTAPKDEKNQASNDPWPPKILDKTTKVSSCKINKSKLRSIENLVQKLSELSSTDDKPSTTDHIALLCEKQKPDYRYVSEILLASGLLLRDLSPTGPMPVQLHPSGHPINPDLFLVLEQTKTGSLPKPEAVDDKSARPKTDPQKVHRKLVFDVVNEVLIQKLELTSSSPHPDHHLFSRRKLARRFPAGQQLLKELCMEIDRLQAEAPKEEHSDGEEIKMSDWEVVQQSEGWVHFEQEVAGVVLEVERMIFKDLIDEVVRAEAASSASLAKSGRRRRQLFAK